MSKKEFVGAFISENAPFVFCREHPRRFLFSPRRGYCARTGGWVKRICILPRAFPLGCPG